MGKKNFNKQDKRTKKSSCFKICVCKSKSDESEDNDDLKTVQSMVKCQSNHRLGDGQITSKKNPFYGLTDSNICIDKFTLLPQNKHLQDNEFTFNENVQDNANCNSNNERLEQIEQEILSKKKLFNLESKKKTDLLIKSILTKYLEMKTKTDEPSDQSNKSIYNELNKHPEITFCNFDNNITLGSIATLKKDNNRTVEENPNQKVKSIITKSVKHKISVASNTSSSGEKSIDSFGKDVSNIENTLNMESSSSNTSGTLLAENGHEELPKRNVSDFPIKTKSAPTNSTAHDSLADISSKFSRFKQEENELNDHRISESKDNLNCKKRLALIFDNPSEELASSYDDGSAISLQYTISCEKAPVQAGLQKQNDVLRQENYEEGFECVKELRTSKVTSRELRIQPSVKGGFKGYTDSVASLKWKIIISHHKDLK